MIFALVGNQNCGKTTLFNALTGSNQHVGNFPGVTVDQKMGEMRDEKGCSVVDLPGIYSLRPYTQEEIVSRDFIINEKPDGIINIVDATNIERNLYLTLQLLELRVPMVLALNMMDEVRANGGAIDVQKMSDALGIPVVPISAAKGEGVSELVDQALSVARSRALPKVTDFCSDDSAVHRCIHAVVHIIADHADRIGVPARFCAAKLIEGGDDLAQVLDLDENERELLEQPLLANPRNAAAGSVRQQDPKVAAARKLDIIIFNLQYDSDRTFATHTQTLDYLASLGFPVVPYRRCETLDACCARIDWIGDNRETFPFDIDGAVIKINDLTQRQYLGSTAKFPRWAVAYKYPPEKKESRVRDIVVQVGRTGVLTPKAVIDPVRLAGTTVTNATLHNQDFIDNLDLRIGDTVLVQKAGEIIPEILSVVREKRPEGTVPFRMPDTCPECGAPVVRDPDGAALRCTGAECPAQRLRNIAHFASREAMDIDGLGISLCQSLIDSGLVRSPAELYSLEPQAVAALDHMGKKSAENLIAAIEKSKDAGMARLLCAFGIRQVGQIAQHRQAGLPFQHGSQQSI